MKNLYMIKTGNQYWYVLCAEDEIEKFNYACQNPTIIKHYGSEFVQVTKLALSDLDEISNISIC